MTVRLVAGEVTRLHHQQTLGVPRLRLLQGNTRHGAWLEFLVEKHPQDIDHALMSYTGWIKGRTIELEKPLPFAVGQFVKVSLETMLPPIRSGSPQAVLEATRQTPHLVQADVAALENAMSDAKLPTHEGFTLKDQP